jgi:hypothetical protein
MPSKILLWREIVIYMDVDIAVDRDHFDTDPAVTVKIRICANVLVHMISIMVHRLMKIKTFGTAPNGRTRRSVDNTAKNLQEQYD